ncbi:MAG: hypothetical protein U1E77_16725 [Inhella sp.]
MRLRVGLMLGLMAQAGAAAQPLLRVCVNETRAPALAGVRPAGAAAAQRLGLCVLAQLSTRSGYRVRVEPMLAALPGSGSVEQPGCGVRHQLPARRDHLGIYPPPAGAPDERYAVRRFDFSWYVRRDSPARWDGQQLSGLPHPVRVTAQPGFSIAQVVRGKGYSVRETARSSEGNLHLLLQGEADAAALQTHEADRVQGLDPALVRGVRKLEPILQQRAYFVVFSRRFHAADPQRALRLWQQMVEVRDSEAYRQAEARVLP